MAASPAIKGLLGPLRDQFGQRLVAGPLGCHPVLLQIELDGSGDLSRPQLRQRFPFGLVVLADGLFEDVNDPTVALDQGPHGSTDRHGTQLAIVTYHDHLGSPHPGVVEEEGHVPVAGHPRLIEDQDVAFGQVHPVVLDAPPEGGQGPRLGKPSLSDEGLGRLAGGRGADGGEPSRLECVPDGGHDRRLAGPGHPFDQLHSPTRGSDPEHGGLLAGGQWRLQDSALAAHRTLGHLGCHSGRPQVLHTPLHSPFDGLFGGQHVGGGKGPYRSSRDTDQRNGIRISEQAFGGFLQLTGGQPSSPSNRPARSDPR